MVGAVIENLSNRKLSYIVLALLLVQIGFVLLGSWYTPDPSSSMDFIMNKCDIGGARGPNNWYYQRPGQACDIVNDENGYNVTNTIHIAQMPHVRDRQQLEYSPWFQFLVGLLQVDVVYDDRFQTRYKDHAKLKLEVRMGYRTREDNDTTWNELINTETVRTLECRISSENRRNDHSYDCDTVDLFELGSCAYPFLLLNIRIPVDESCATHPSTSDNCDIGYVREMRIIAIQQNGGFTFVWLWLKTIVTPFVVVSTWWFWNRVQLLPRRPLLLEKAIFALGCSMAVLDFPFEWLSLVARVPFMLLLNDIRQGLFYTVLLSFWLIFAGEHLIDDSSRNNLYSYWRNLSLVCTASISLLIYDICERGMQLVNPFATIWSTQMGTKIAHFSIYLAAFASLAYIVFLFYKIWLVWSTIKQKRSGQLYQTNENRRLKVDAIIYRFKFLMLFTLLCAALTVLAYVVKQHGESQMYGEEPTGSFLLKNAASAFFTGTFGMWNIYVVLLLAMYAPSHKHYTGAQLIDESEVLIDGGSEANPLTTFLKPSTD